jgi:chaperonin GroEL (HSP60 family)
VPTPPEPGADLEAVTEPGTGLESPRTRARVFGDAERRVAMLERRGQAVATGFLVGPDLLLTAGHALLPRLTGPPSVDAMTAVFDHLEGSPRTPYETGTRVPLAQLLEYSGPADSELAPWAAADPVVPADRLDFALVRLARRPPDAVDEYGNAVPRGWYGLDSEPYDFSGGGSLHVFQHPLSKPQQHSSTAGAVSLTDDGMRVRYRANTLRGSSGGAVVNAGGRLVAVHQSFPETGRRFGEVRNQGVPVSLIAAVLRAGEHADLLQPPDATTSGAAPATAAPATAARGPVARGAAAVGAVMAGLFGPQGSAATVPGPGGVPVRVRTAREVVERYVPEDQRQLAGVELVADAVRTMELRAGDGAVTAALLASVLIEEADRRRGSGAGLAELGREAAEAMARARAELARLGEPCGDPRAVTAAATPDREIAEAAAAAVLRAGPDGVLLCEPGDSRSMVTVTRQGLRVPAGYASAHTATDPWSGRATLVRPYLLLLDSVVGDSSGLRRLLRQTASEGRRLLILTSQHDAGLLGGLHELGEGPVPPVVRVPDGGAGQEDPARGGTGARSRLRALAVLSGATLLTEDSGLRAETAWFELLGQAELALVSATETIIVGGQGRRPDVDRWLATARAKRRQADPSQYAVLDEQVAWLSAEAVCLRVGADSPDALAVRTEAARRAARAGQAALRGGAVPGGGHALLRCRAALTAPGGRPGTEIVRAALAAPFRLLARSAGLGDPEIDRLVEASEGPPGPVGSPGPSGPPLRDATQILDLALGAATTALHDFVSRARVQDAWTDG